MHQLPVQQTFKYAYHTAGYSIPHPDHTVHEDGRVLFERGCQSCASRSFLRSMVFPFDPVRWRARAGSILFGHIKDDVYCQGANVHGADADDRLHRLTDQIVRAIDGWTVAMSGFCGLRTIDRGIVTSCSPSLMSQWLGVPTAFFWSWHSVLRWSDLFVESNARSWT